MRIRTLFRLVLIAVIVAAVIIIAAQFDAVSSFGRNVLSAVGISRTRRVESSRIVLEEVREVFELSTIEYVYRAVFPYDFMDPSVSIASIMRTLRSANGRIETLLSPVEREYFEAYNLARDVGLAAVGDVYEFIVITVVVGAGYDLSGSALAAPETLAAEEIADIVAIEEEWVEGRTIRRITLPLPQPVITYVVIEDRDTSSYPYPDVPIQPDGFRRIAGFVGDRVRERTIEEGILTEASERGRNAIRSLLLETGYDEVEFRAADGTR